MAVQVSVVSFLAPGLARRGGGGGKVNLWLEATALVWITATADWQPAWIRCRCKQSLNGLNMGRRCQFGHSPWMS